MERYFFTKNTEGLNMSVSFLDKYVKNQKQNLKYSEISLPVSGLLYPKIMDKQIKVFPLTVGKEMELYESFIQILKDDKLLKKYQLYDILIDDIVEPIEKNSNFDEGKLTSLDLEFILYNMRILTGGQEVKLNLTCPNCQEFENKQLSLNNSQDIENDKEQKNDEEINQEIDKLQKEYHIKNFIKQQIAEGNFQRRSQNVSIQNPKINIPNKQQDVIKVIELKSGIKLSITLPLLGNFKQIKGFIFDFRTALTNFYEKHEIEYDEDKLDDEYDMFMNFQNIQLYIYKINDDFVTSDNQQEIPLTLKNILMKGDMELITGQIKELVEKYSLKLPYKYKCERCGHEISGDVSNSFLQYIFGSTV